MHIFQYLSTNSSSLFYHISHTMFPSIKVPFFPMQFEVDFDEWSQFSREMREELCTALTLDVKSFVSPFDLTDFFESYICQKQTRLKLKHPIFFREDVDNILTPKDDLATKSSLKRPFFRISGIWKVKSGKMRRSASKTRRNFEHPQVDDGCLGTCQWLEYEYA